MEKIPAKDGWLWVRQGFALFRKQPAEMSTLFLSYMFLMLALGIIPVLGQMLPLVLIPVFAMSFMQACRQVEKGERVYPNLLLAGFRDPARNTLLKLGLLYLLAATLAVAVSALADGGVFWKAMMGGGLSAEELEAGIGGMRIAMLISAALYVPAAMAFWYAAPLIMWQRMPLGKALFYSFFTVRRAGGAFLLYALIWIVIAVMVPTLISLAITLLTGSINAVIFVMLPISIILTVVIYCSFYPTYTAVFGKPSNGPDSPPPAGDRPL
ncbi:BPSS1780 family membrane protein [Herbaspirillum sp. WKF16]|uniref:BPSS1780 family membrane protein n=1 Tax=Herbaspirillum sp. WKF16 TaxID=3028312 RepID=UPI0023A94C7F|nr:BPSS1780 family membrane protein [Herbaspirillum sp. WKF16]WDZ96575.1 BPSS1780 family membrane protein [Herbaspirillum sp. WKF16]